MNLAGKLKRLEALAGGTGAAIRICAELNCLYNLSAVRDHIYDSELEASTDRLLSLCGTNGCVSLADVGRTEEELSPLAAEIKAYTVHCIAHAHIDMNWRWGYQETAIVVIDTMRTMLDLMREYPDFRFSQSQASVYEVIEKYAPELLGEIRARVAEGRFEVSASTWTECDKNMPSCESLIRHTLYTKRYLSELLGIDPDSLRLDFEPDTFGHTLNLPEILGSAGVDRYYHCRGCDLRQAYNWRAPSGKTLLVYQDANFYLGAVNPSCFTEIALHCRDISSASRDAARVYGVGDHGGGPTRADLEAIIEMSGWPLFPTLKFSTYRAFFDELEKVRALLPTVTGEQNFVFTGCYTTQSRIKMANKIGEARLFDAELISSAACLTAEKPLPAADFAGAWKPILFSQFHDILPGSGMIETREYALGTFQSVMATAQGRVNEALRTIADNIDTSSVPFDDVRGTRSEGGGVGCLSDYKSMFRFSAAERGRGNVRAYHVFNTSRFTKREPVELMVWDFPSDTANLTVTDSRGSRVKHVITVDKQNYWAHNYSRVTIDADIPAFGYETYILSAGDPPGLPAPHYNGAPRRDTFSDDDIILENDRVRAVFDAPTMKIVSLTDKNTGRELVSPGVPSGFFSLIKENPRHNMTSWRVGEIMSEQDLNATCPVRVTSVKRNELFSSVTYSIAFERSKLDVTVKLLKNSNGLLYDVTADWLECPVQGDFIPQLRFNMPVAYSIGRSLSDIALGRTEREPLCHDVPCTGAFALLEASGKTDSFVFLCSDSKYGYRAMPKAGSITLLRSSYDPDPFPELGRHHMLFGAGVASAIADADAYNDLLNHPPIYTGAAPARHGGKLPLSGRFITPLTENTDIALTAFKPAEDGGVLLRVENRGDSRENAVFDLWLPFAAAVMTNGTEKPLADVAAPALTPCGEGARLSFEAPPHAVTSVLLTL